MDAMARFLAKMGWNLFSMVIQDFSNTNQGLTYLTRLTVTLGLCLHDTIFVTPASDFDAVLKTLTESKPRVVVAFVSTKCAELILAAIDTKMREKLIWLVTDSWLYLTVLPGSIVFSFSSLEEEELHVDRESLLENPWFKQLVRQSSCRDQECTDNYAADVENINSQDKGEIHDTVIAYAYALKDLIHARCPKATGTVAETCFDKFQTEFPTFLKNVIFSRKSGDDFLTPDGVQINLINIFQNVYSTKTTSFTKNIIAKYNFKNFSFEDFGDISWDFASFPVNETSFRASCRPDCNAREHMDTYGCCWACKMCQPNEIVSENGTRCLACSIKHWPALRDGKYSVCNKINPVHIEWFEPVSLIFMSVDLGNFILMLVVFVLLRRHKDPQERDSPLWLLVVQLLSTLWGIISVPIFLDHPGTFSCSIATILFITSLSVQYMVLLFRAVYIFRVGTELDELDIQMTSHLSITLFLVFFAIIEITTYIFLYRRQPIGVHISQRSLHDDYVDMVCEIPESHIVAFLIFAILLLLLTSVTSMKTKTSSTFGHAQSRFLFSFVAISLILWVVFMPAYFIVTHSRLRMYLLISVVLVNHSGALLLSFTPRLILACCIKKSLDPSEYYSLFRRSIIQKKDSTMHEPPVAEKEVVFKVSTPELQVEYVSEEHCSEYGSPV